jgi:hypothetical protein
MKLRLATAGTKIFGRHWPGRENCGVQLQSFGRWDTGGYYIAKEHIVLLRIQMEGYYPPPSAFLNQEFRKTLNTKSPGNRD